MNEKALKLYFYVDGVNDTPFPTASSQIEITDFTYDAKRMGGAPLISCEVMYPTCLDDVWTDNVYAMFNGEKYFLKQTPTSSFSNTDSRYKHEVELVSERMVLDNAYFYDVVASNVENDKPVSNSSVVKFYGDIHEFAKRLNYSLQYAKLQQVDASGEYVSGYRVIVDDDVATDSEMMSFENQFMSNVLQEIYNTFEIPYYFVGKGIHIGYSPNKIDTVFQYGVDNALLSIQKTNANFKVVNRVTGIGSPDNIPYYYPNQTERGDISVLLNGVAGNAKIINTNKFGKFSLTDTLKYVYDENGYYLNFVEGSVYDWDELGGVIEDMEDERIYVHFDLRFVIPVDASDNEFTLRFSTNDRGIERPGRTPNHHLELLKIESSSIRIWEKYFFSSATDLGFTDDLTGGEYVLSYTCESPNDYLEKNPNATFKDYINEYITLEMYQKNEAIKQYWTRNDIRVSLEKLGVAINEGVTLNDGDMLTLRLDKYIAPQQTLMPPIYRESLGAERFYNALNETYIDPESKLNEYYHFKNPFIASKPKEQIVNFEDIHPTIVGMDNANGKLIGMFTEFAYDDDDNDETEEIEGSLHYKHPFFFGKLRKFDGDFGFNLFDHSIDEDEMIISFTDGSCGGCEFAIVVNENQENTVQVYEDDTTDEDGTFHAKGSLKRDAKGNVLCGREIYQSAQTAQAIQNDTLNNEVWVALRKDDKTFGFLMPKAPVKDADGTILQAGLKPKADVNNNNTGDKFVILHINLPQAYIYDAEDRLKDAIIKYMSENNIEKFNFSIDFSRIYLANNTDIFAQLNENSFIKVRYNNIVYPLYVTSYSYKVANNEALPNVSVELSNALTITQNSLQNAISEVKSDLINYVDVVNNEATNGSSVANKYTNKFLRKDVADTAKGLINFEAGANFGNEQNYITPSGNAKFSSTNTDSLLTKKATIDSDKNGVVVSSSNFDFTSALTGYGYGIMKEGNSYKMAIDYLTVRKGMTVAELVIQEYKSVGGVLVLSACNGEIDSAVQDDDSGSPYWMINIKDWDKHPQFRNGDIIRCSRWDDATNEYVSYIGIVDASEAEYEGAHQHIYVHLVSGDATPQVGDNLVQFGSTTDTLRQGLIIISTEEGKPNITLYDGLNSADVNMVEKMTARLGNLNGLVKDGKEMSGYGLWTNNLYLGSKAEEVFKELINIGGRNYALGTSTPFTNNISTTASDWQEMRMYFAKGLKAGDVANVSFDWSAVGANNATINKIKLQLGYGTETSISQYQDGEELLLSTATGTYNCQMAVPDGVTEDTTIHVRLRVFSNSVTSITVSHLMLQKGQGDWQPAPEDALNALAEYKEEISHEFEVTNQGLSSVQRSVTQLKDGSRNLLLATNQGATGWKPSNVYRVDGVKGEYTAFTREVYSSENHHEFLCFDLRPELIQKGKQYLLSFEIYLPEDYSNVDNVAMFTAFASPSFTDVLSHNSNERNNQKTQIGSWVKMEYVITANASGAKDDATSVYISIARADYNKFQYFYIRNLQLLERTVDSTTAVSDDEFLPWRPALEDANNYADLVAEQAKETAIQQTKEDININAYAKKTYVGEMIEVATADIKIEAGKISQSVSDLKTSVDGQISGLESKIEQTASNISLKVKELGVSNLNYAYGTGTKAKITSLGNINNQTVQLYEVTGLSGGEKISVSCLLRVKNIIFDTDSATANNRTSAIYLQFNENFGYIGLGITITADTFKDADGNQVTPDEEGYLNVRIKREGLALPMYQYVNGGANPEYPITPDVVSSIFTRLDFIDSAVDTEGNDIGVIEISELKVEKGTECTAWTARTQDMDTALLDTGIDIESKVITATADKFQIKNNAGFVTASVDEQGRLVTSTVQCRNMESTTSDATKFVTTINEYNNNGWITFYYPLDNENAIGNKAFEIGWDDVTSSMMRFYNKDGVMTWKAGSESNLISTLPTEEKTEEVITEAKLYRIPYTNKLAAGNAIKVSTMLPNNAGIWEKKVYKYTASATTLVGTSYYTDATCNTPVNSEEYFTDSGSPQFVIGSQGSPQSYKRSLFKIMNSQKSEVETIKWLANESLNDTFIPLPTSN